MSDIRFTEAILQWYRANARDLPWRRTHDPYAIWLSEIILQQTRVAQGLAYWERFMQRFPDVESLAAAPDDEVMRLWQGLGYYSRARNLHTAAKQIVAQGGFPCTYEGIRALKGVGDYTAAAIASIAYGLPVAVVDGNVYRVLARHYGIEIPINTTEAKRVFTTLAQSLLPADKSADFNQGVMDFGAMQCVPSSPLCDSCVVRDTCMAVATGRVEALPVKKVLRAKTQRHFVYVYMRCKGMTALHRREAGDILQGLWEPPLFESLPEQFADAVPLRKNVRHQLTHITIMADFYLLDCEERPALPKGCVWVEEAALERYGKPRLVEMLIAALG